jgi:hypothetical protein
MARVLLSFALSMAVIPLILFVLNYVWSLALYPSLIAVDLFIVTTSAIALWRLRKPPLEASAPGLIEKQTFCISMNVSKGFRFVFWILLVGLTLGIILFPVQITLKPSLLESLNIFTDFNLFAGLFLGWLAIFIFLLFSRNKESKQNWEQLALVCIFALVFVGFWIVKTPYGVGDDSPAHYALIAHIQETGALPNSTFGYSEFPGIFLFSNFLSQITMLDLFTMAQVVRIVSVILFAGLIFLFFNNSLGNGRLSLIAILLLTVAAGTLSPGGSMVRTSFRPDLLGGVFWLAFLVILTKDKDRPIKTSSDALIVVILLLATTITYLGHSMLFFFVLVGMYLTDKIAGGKSINLTTVLLPLIVVLSWEVYWAVSNFYQVSQFIPMMAQQIFSGDIFSFMATGAASTISVASEIPFLVTATRYLRWIFLGAGTTLTTIGVIFIRRLSSLDRRIVGGIVGTLFLALFTALLSPRGFQFQRYIFYSPVFLTPIIIKSLMKLGERWRKLSLTVLLIPIFVFSLPSFLAFYGESIATKAIPIQDVEAGEFLRSQYGSGGGLNVFSNNPYGYAMGRYYIPDANEKGPTEGTYIEDANVIFQDMDNLLAQFRNLNKDKIFIYNERQALWWYEVFQIEPTDQRWENLKHELAGENGENIIFSNDYVHIYATRQNESSVGKYIKGVENTLIWTLSNNNSYMQFYKVSDKST